MATAQTAGSKPDYIGLLNTISLAESAAGVYLEAWANATKDEELAQCLRLVALRESQHGDAFCRRLSELGYPLQQRPDPEAGARVARYANPNVSDCEKIGPERESTGRDPFAEIEQAIADGKYDPMTANMMKWYITEERDSGRRLKVQYDRVRAAMNGAQPAMANGKANGQAAAAMAGPSGDAQAIMSCMTDGFARLEKSIEKLARALK